MNTTQLISHLESLTPEEKTPELAELEKELRGHGKYFNELMTQIATTGVLTEEIRKEREERGKVMRRVAEKVLARLSALETLAHLKETYETQVSRYRSLGWIVEKKGKEGIVGVNKKFYPVPSFDNVKNVLSEQGELFIYKHSQGFKKIMLVPFGMSYVEMYNKLHTEYKRYVDDDDLKLFRTDLKRTQLTEIYIDPTVSDVMEMQSELGYYPETLYSDDPKVHKAKSKAELISDSCTRFPGWELHLIPENPPLVRKQKDKAPECIGDRPVFEGNEYFGDYLDRMKGREGTNDKKVQPVKDAEGQNVYRGEVGLIPEVWAAWALEELYTNKRVLHDSDSNPKDLVAILMGTLIKEKFLAVSFFSKNLARVILNHNYVGNQNMRYAGASSVKVC